MMAAALKQRTEAQHDALLAFTARRVLQQFDMIGPAMKLLAQEIGENTVPDRETVSRWSSVADWLAGLVMRERDDLHNEDSVLLASDVGS